MKIEYKMDSYLIKDGGYYWSWKGKKWTKTISKGCLYGNLHEAESKLKDLELSKNARTLGEHIQKLMEELDVRDDEILAALESIGLNIEGEVMQNLEIKGYTIIEPCSILTKIELDERLQNLDIIFY